MYTEDFTRWVKNTFTTQSGRVKPNASKKLPNEIEVLKRKTPKLNGVDDKTRIRCVLLGVERIPTCANPDCRNKTSFDNKAKQFSKYCSTRCAYDDPTHREQISETKKEKYAKGELVSWQKGLTKEDDPRIAENVRKGSETLREKYQKGELEAWNKGRTKDTDPRIEKQSNTINSRTQEKWDKINRKREQTVQDKYGAKNVFQLETIKRKSRETSYFRFGVEYPQQAEEVKSRQKETNFRKYGVFSNLESEEIRKKGIDALLEKYGGYFSQSKEFQERKNEIFSKMRKTNIEKYGVESVSQNPQVEEKRINTLMERYGVTSPAFLEEVQKKRRRSFYNNTRKKKKESYPELSIDEINLIENEYRSKVAFFTEVSYKEYSKYINKTNNERDIDNHIDHKFSVSEGFLKRISPVVIGSPGNLILMTAEENKRKRNKCSTTVEKIVEESSNIFADEEERDSLTIEEDYDKMFLSLQSLREKEGRYNSTVQGANDVILTYQPHFYEVENSLWNRRDIKKRLLWNRYYYLERFPFELTNKEILRGFKISGLHYGFSHFSPLWFRAFIEEFGIERVYDPCGGWGHRLLGAQGLSHYIYNDVDKRTVDGCERIANDFGIVNTTFYNAKAEEFTPPEAYKAVFTCPPYWDKEDYQDDNTSHKLYSTYDSWLNEWWGDVVDNSLKDTVKYFAFVTSPSLKDDMGSVVEQRGLRLVREQPLGPGTKSHFQNEKTHRDILMIYAL